MPSMLPLVSYAYLLGIYLGDGTLSRSGATSYRLRVACDTAYPRVMSEIKAAIGDLAPTSGISVTYRSGTRCAMVAACSPRWRELFPQHGRGRKHLRRIVLADWQQEITREHPKSLVRGLMHSDGSRFIARQRMGDRIYCYVRYEFSNRSEDIKAILCEHLDALDIPWTRPNSKNIQIARRRGVDALEEFVGPKA